MISSQARGKAGVSPGYNQRIRVTKPAFFVIFETPRRRVSLPQGNNFKGEMMIVYLYFEETQVAKYEVEAVPPVGALIEFRMKKARGQFKEGWLVRGKVSSDHPPEFDFETLAPKLLVNVTVYDIQACLE